MHIQKHQTGETAIAEVLSDQILIRTPADGLQLLADLYYQGFDGVILNEHNITADFFDLKTGIAGEVLQKFTNYRVRLAIVGDFAEHASNSLKDFIFESNKGKQINFLPSVEEAVGRLSK